MGETTIALILGMVNTLGVGVFGVIMWKLKKPVQDATVQKVEADALTSMVQTLADTTKEFSELIREAVKGRNAVEAELKSAREEIAAMKMRQAELQTLHKDEMEAMEARHKVEVAALEEKLNRQHKIEIESIRQAHREELEKLETRLKQQHAAEMDTLRKNHKLEMDKLTDQQKQNQLRITDLEGKLKQYEQSASIEGAKNEHQVT